MARPYKGDIGDFRWALHAAGYRFTYTPSIFNDDSKAKVKTGNRRLKLWMADQVFYSSYVEQCLLEDALRNVFKNRILAMYYVEASHPYGRHGSKSLCIKLKDI